MKKPVVLRIFKGNELQGVKQFTDSQIVMGRPGEVQVALENDNGVSTIHAAIEERDTGYFICDLGSEAGTLKNGEPVLDAPIESGDIIQVGGYRIEFYVGVPKPKTNPTIDITALNAQIKEEEKRERITPPPTSTFAPPPADKVAKPATSNISSGPVIPPAAMDVFPSPSSASSPGSPTASRASGVSMAGPRGVASTPRRNANGGSVDRNANSKRTKTFAPPSKYSDVKDYVKPSKGTVVEVLIAWGERIIETRHFSEKQTVTLGSSPSCDIVLPVSRIRKTPLLQIDRVAKVLVSPEMTGELVRGQTSSSFADLLRQNKMNKDGNAYAIMLEQGEMVRLDLADQISVIVRYVSDSPKPLVAPILDLTAAEFTGVVLAGVLIAILRLYTFLYTPPVGLPGEEIDEPIRIAVIATPTPLPPIPPPKTQVEAVPTPAPTPPPPVVKATPQPKKAQTITQAQKKAETKPVTNLTTKNDPGKSANAAPNPNKKVPTKVTSVKQGGAIKTTQNQGSQMNSKPKELNKLFSAFGGGGAQNELSQSTTGAGELAGLANAANGKSGQSENRAGPGLGSLTKDTGAGGTGKALETGIHGGVGTNGRGSGNGGYGTGGLGNKAGTRIVTGGAGETFSGTIDREAIRRVLKANERTIKSCYEKQLNRNPDLTGKLVLTWDIADGGQAINVRTSSNELGNQEVAQCIMDHLKTWKFPDPPSNQTVEVSYPWFFSN